MFIAPEKYKFTVSLIVLFFTVGAITASFTFVDLLFLSSYPTDWLPYLFLGKTVTLLVFTLLVSRLVSNGSRWINAALLGSLALTILLSRWLLEFPNDGFPFMLALWLDVGGVILGVVAFNAVYSAFDVREMKVLGRWIQVSAGLGGLIFGLSVPTIIAVMGANQLLFVIATGFAIAAIGLSSLSALPVSYRESQQAVQPLTYPLFVRTAIAFILLLIIDTLADFLLKREIGLTYERDQIGAFMGPFYGIANALTVLMQLSAVTLVLKSIGIRGLLMAVPVFGIVAGVGLLLLPGLWMAVVFRMGETVLRRGFDDFGRALAVNPLPSQVRRLSRLAWNGVCAPIGIGIATMLMLTFGSSADYSTMSIAIVTMLLATGWLIMTHFTMTAYRQTLEEAVRVKRFVGDMEALEANPQLLIELVQRSLASSDSSEVLFGLQLLVTHKIPLPEEVLRHLESPSQDLRAAAANAITLHGEAGLSGVLLQRLEIEEVAEIRALLLEALASIAPESALEVAEHLLGSSAPEDRFGAVQVLRRAGNPEQISCANAAVTEMGQATEPRFRCAAALALGEFEAGQRQSELRALLDDSDDSVRIAALKSVAKRHELALIPEVAALLDDGAVSFIAGRILAGFGKTAIPALVGASSSMGHHGVRAALHALGRIEGSEAELALNKLYQNANVSRRTAIAKEAVTYACRFGASNDFTKRARDFALAAFDEVHALQVAARQEKLVWMRTEIEARSSLAKQRLLAWFAVATDPAQVYDLMPLILPLHGSHIPPVDHAKAVELLDSLTQDAELKVVLGAFESAPLVNMPTPIEVNDEWLDWFATQRSIRDRGEPMDLLEKVLLLRKCSLFKELQGELLREIADVSELRVVTHGERIFSEGDYPDGLYVIVSGFVNLMQGKEVIDVLKHADSLGGLEILDDSPRMADAVAANDGMLLFLTHQAFDNLTTDTPEVLRGLTLVTIKRLRSLLPQVSSTDDSLTRFASIEETPPKEIDLRKTIQRKPETALNPIAAHNQFVEIETDASVKIEVQDNEEVTLVLASHSFLLRAGSTVVLIDPHGVAFKLEDGGNMIGRDERCDIVVNASLGDISRQHLVIRCESAGVFKITNLSRQGITRVAAGNIV